MEHVQAKHEKCDESGCPVCELFVCAVCGAYEGGLATECPGVKTTTEQDDEVYAGRLDFVGGQWVKK